LRIKDVNFDRGELRIRDGKGGKDRVTMLSAAMKGPGVARASGCEYNDDLLSRFEPGRARRAESARSARVGSSPVMNPNAIHRAAPHEYFAILFWISD
jgi:integrase